MTCDDYPDIDEVTMTGDIAVYTCPIAQAGCTAQMVGQPALFECVSSHFPNCLSQNPTGGSSWQFVMYCSDL